MICLTRNAAQRTGTAAHAFVSGPLLQIAAGRGSRWLGLGRCLRPPPHQGCAMDVLARIESVNMYWYVWVCILACILVRIGMYQLGTY